MTDAKTDTKTDAQKIQILLNCLYNIATMPDIGTPGGQFNRARIFAKMTLRDFGFPEHKGSDYSHGTRKPLFYRDLFADLALCWRCGQDTQRSQDTLP